MLDLPLNNNRRLFRPFWIALHFLKVQQYVYIASFTENEDQSQNEQNIL